MTILREKEDLDEMADQPVSSYSDGLPFRVVVRHPDHQPPHAHIMDLETGKKELGQFEVSHSVPRKASDIKDYKQGISEEAREIIFNWAHKPNKLFFNEIINWKILIAENRRNEKFK